MTKSVIQRFHTVIRLLASPLTREVALWVAFTAAWLINVHFTHQPARRIFASSLTDLWLTTLLAGITLRLLPRRVRPCLRWTAIAAMTTLCWVEAFLAQRFKMVYSPLMFTLMAETNDGESSEFLRVCLRSPELWRTLWPYLLTLLIVVGISVAPWSRLKFNRPWMESAKAIARLVAATAVCALPLWANPGWWDLRCKAADLLSLSQSGQIERVSSRPYYSPGLRLCYSGKFWALIQQEGDVFTRHTQEAIRQQAHTAKTDSACVTPSVTNIVLVIGESYNKHHAQIYGYPRPTTPNMARMQRQGSLTVFTDVVSPWNITSQVMKWLMSTESMGNGHGWAEGVLWPAIFRQAGWDVTFVTNQYVAASRKNKIDYSGSFFLNTQPLDSLAFDRRNEHKYQYDGQLLQELDSLRTAANAKSTAAAGNLLILHLVGQHMDARLRVPETWWRWKESDYNRPDLSEKERQTLADYDNATRYNDNVFSRLCQRYRHEDAIVIYLSDHGDEVYDPALHMYGRNHAAHPSEAILRSEYEVPFVVWASPKCRRAHRHLMRQIRACRERPFMTDDVCHMLLGIAGISSPYYNQERDLLSPTYNEKRPRLIKGTDAYELSPLPLKK